MDTQHYVCHKTDEDNMVVVRTDPACPLQRALIGGFGAALLLHGVRRSGWIAALTTLAGADLLSRAAAGKSLLKALADVDGRKCASHANAPSYHDEGILSGQEPADEVEEASMASFPASDPPAFHRTTPSSTESTNANSPKGDNNVDGQ